MNLTQHAHFWSLSCGLNGAQQKQRAHQHDMVVLSGDKVNYELCSFCIHSLTQDSGRLYCLTLVHEQICQAPRLPQSSVQQHVQELVSPVAKHGFVVLKDLNSEIHVW